MKHEAETYEEFLQRKAALASNTGFAVDASEVSAILKPHQRDIVMWAVNGGRRAIFAAFGLGKTLMQLEIMRLILKKSGGGKALIVTPLGVRQEFRRDAQLIRLTPVFVRTNAESSESDNGIFLTNYESIREGKLDPTQFKAISLDEAAILRGFGGTKTFRELMRMFEGTSIYRFVATATPSPNEYIELLSYAAFLDIMDVGQAKTRFFKRDSTRADMLNLHPHKEREFWLWVSTWAIFLQKPSDLGYDDAGYELPALDVRWHELPTDHTFAGQDRDGQGKLLKDAAIGVQDAAREKRDSLRARIDKLIEIREENPAAHRLIWHDLEAERHLLEKTIPECATIYGNQDLETREQVVMDFSDGKIQELAAKPVLAGSGCNFQRYCSQAVFLGIGFKFNDFIQAIHRIHRFLQKKRVRIDIIYTEAEKQVKRTLERKWTQHNILVEQMQEIIRTYGLAHAAVKNALTRTIGTERVEIAGDDWTLVKNDAVDEVKRLESETVDLILTSIPFSTQYEYSPSYNDFGHNESNDTFFEQMDFLTPDLIRILKPGRIAVIHVKDRIIPGGITGLGFQTVYPFHADCIRHYQKYGFAYLGMKTVVTDVVRENNQTYRLGWSEQCKDATKMGWGMPEYLLLFRKPQTDRTNGYGDFPVVKRKPQTRLKGSEELVVYDYDAGEIVVGTGYSRARWQIDAHGFARSSGNRLLTREEMQHLPHADIYKLWRDESLTQIYDYERHVRLGEFMEEKKRLPSNFMLMPPHTNHPDVWADVARMRTLNMSQQAKGRQMHLCPMQFDIADRIIVQFSQPGELVFDPFVGIGTVVMCAVKLGRRGYGVELAPDYFLDAVAYCQTNRRTPTLFDFFNDGGSNGNSGDSRPME